MHLMHNAQNELRILPIVCKLQNGPSGGMGGVVGVQIIYTYKVYICSICQMSCFGWDSSSIWCAQIFALNTTTRSRHNRHQVDDCMSGMRGSCRGGRASEAQAMQGRCGSKCQSGWPNIIKTRAREGSNCCCANIGAYKCNESAAKRGKGGQEGSVQQGCSVHCMNITEVQHWSEKRTREFCYFSYTKSAAHNKPQLTLQPATPSRGKSCPLTILIHDNIEAAAEAEPEPVGLPVRQTRDLDSRQLQQRVASVVQIIVKYVASSSFCCWTIWAMMTAGSVNTHSLFGCWKCAYMCASVCVFECVLCV